ncbi:hypothetical protein V865_007670 [Kwoniella europaea PYCC6329]|uniref:HpcH/HpaI aldolase/citrate lyase domain-containing protein n=1 Tax=Kwoniella europaea PYCC6329 TaxID=1423913 RepID=A0AAX4KUV6_9TREE
MEAKTYLRNALQAKQPGLGFCLPGACTISTVLATGGFNWVLIDAEHGAITDKDYFDRALDAGAHGVMTPMCHNAEDAKKIVSFSKYPPTGSRGYGPMFCPPVFGCKGSEYDSQADEKLLVIVQIESRQGPFDLSKQMNVQFGGEEHEAAIAKTLKAAHAAGKVAAIFCSNGQIAKQRLDQGFDMVSIAVDNACLAAEMERQMGFATGTTKTGDRSYS